MQVKEPFKLCQQIEKLKSKGCCIDDENKAKQILNQINYYKLSAYFLPFKNPDGSYKFDTSLYKVYKIYEFDKKVSAFLYEVIQEVETFIKVHIYLLFGHCIQTRLIGKILSLIYRLS